MTRELRREPDDAAGLAEAAVELPVLPALDALVEEADGLDGLAAEAAEVHRLGRPLLAADVERRSAEADTGAVGAGDRPLERLSPLASMMPPTLAAPVRRSVSTAMRA